MKKQSHGYNPDRQYATAVTPFPGQAVEGSTPKGLHDHHHSQPTHLKKGAAESRKAKPVEMPRRDEHSSSRETSSNMSVMPSSERSSPMESPQKTIRRRTA